jgi:hypothetical protein
MDRLLDEDARCTLRLQLPKQRIHLALPGSDRPEGEDRGAMVLGDRGDRDGRFVDISSDRKRARLVHG